MSENKSILICRCTARGLLSDVDEISGSVPPEKSVVIPDLCSTVGEGDPILAEIASAESPIVYACHPRAVRALFDFAGSPLPGNAQLINLRDPSIHQSDSPSVRSDSAWFPVIDYDRCTACGQCVEFCLFGVYEKDETGRVVVAHPECCRNNCPACARICPRTAIIFPKVGESPIDGAQIDDESARRANIEINVNEMLGDDVYAALNARRQKRRLLLNRKKVEKALRERRKCAGDQT